jgi:hypothetical protein
VTLEARGFRSIDQRLPNPDRPYEMTSGTVKFDAPPFFSLYDLEFAPTDPAQLDIPTRTNADTLVFDSEYDISYRAWVSFGLGPVHSVSGFGRARAVGEAPADTNPQVFETELLRLDLYGLSPIPEVYFRESPTVASKGVTTRRDLCPACAGPVTYWEITSFFNVYGEFSADGGHTWTPGDTSFRIQQLPPSRPLLDDAARGEPVFGAVPEPTGLALSSFAALCLVTRQRRSVCSGGAKTILVVSASQSTAEQQRADEQRHTACRLWH